MQDVQPDQDEVNFADRGLALDPALSGPEDLAGGANAGPGLASAT